ncbi:unnamed protein product [Toxocara canis]|uniref:Uncharacterized protein n=1 Tax=Toxocara canis TaxID=6265 RepID=A0A183VEY6_TOXCA|nr:unnamed protein product [Toxocara canis]
MLPRSGVSGGQRTSHKNVGEPDCRKRTGASSCRSLKLESDELFQLMMAEAVLSCKPGMELETVFWPPRCSQWNQARLPQESEFGLTWSWILRQSLFSISEGAKPQTCAILLFLLY